MQVGFLFNHDQIHQVAHSLPVAMELARRGRVDGVSILTSGPHLTTEVRRLLRLANVDLPVTQLGLTSRASRLAAGLLNALLPAAKLALYRDHLDVFAAFDILVVAEKTSAILKTRYGLDDLRLVHTRHGAGDRAIGFDRASRDFDHVLVAGPAIRERLIREAGVDAGRVSVTGYPKFDLERYLPAPARLFANDRPTVLYNPHVAPHLSSWFRDGRAVLDHFARSDRYNLIFAPHVMLFHRSVAVTLDPLRLHVPGGIPRHIRDCPHIHIDLSSPASTDMTYTRSADIYLGDVSSQIYEFLLHPRPCIFLNSHAIAYENNESFAHWQAGRVIHHVGELEAALREAVRAPLRLIDVQRALFASHIQLEDEPSSCRAARAVEALAFGPSALGSRLEPDGRRPASHSGQSEPRLERLSRS